MPKLLVTKPNGNQGVIYIDETGGYYDESKIIWDERRDGELPANIVPEAMVRVGDALSVDPSKLTEVNTNKLADIKKESLLTIDHDTDKVINDTIGRLDTEYLVAENQAIAYIASGYAGDAPPYVRCWAEAKKETDQWAADNIMYASTSWRAAQISLRTERLKDKELIRTAQSIEEINATLALWKTYVNSLRSELGV